MSVMLATGTSGKDPTKLIDELSGEYLFDIKWDGVRCVVRVADDGFVTLTNRNGVDITKRYPDIAVIFEGLGFPVTLDGEIVAFGADGRPNFQLLARRDRLTKEDRIRVAAQQSPVTFVAFDLLTLKGVEEFRNALENRLIALKDVHEHVGHERFLRSPVSSLGHEAWSAITTLGLEGLVAKRVGSRYHAGRSPDWLKIKQAHRVSALVSGYEGGSGWATGLVGALLLELHDTELGIRVPLGKVGTGFTKTDRKLLTGIFDDRGRPTRDVVVEVEYHELTKDGKPRFPSYKGIRSDVEPSTCTTDQLTHQGGRA